jgi:hypothetical protein
VGAHLACAQGLSSSFFFCLGGAGLILMETARQASPKTRTVLLVVGAGCLAVAFVMLRLFIRIKVPNYLVSTE